MRTYVATGFRVAVRVTLAGAILAVTSAAAPATPSRAATPGPDPRTAAVIAHWTPERLKAAIHRDLLLDSRGLGYLRTPAGLVPYGHSTPALPSATSVVSSGGATPLDLVGPAVTNRDPAAGVTIGSSKTFLATVLDSDGVKTVSFQIKLLSGTQQSFSAAKGTNGTWSVPLSGFSNGAWQWRVVAKDGAKPGNTSTTPWLDFTVDTSGGGGTGGGGGGTGAATTVALGEWTSGGTIQTAAGRIYFEMPANKVASRWNGYICSGTVVTDATSGVSMIITAAHCVYDDANKAFARNVLFIPNQAGTSASATDLTCSNDPMGCWAPSYGVVDQRYTTSAFPTNNPWDYAFYVVPDSGAHSGATATSDVLAIATGTLDVSFTAPTVGATTTALGYPGAQDPKFMYCVDALSAYSADNWYLAGCGLGGGASGGPWSASSGGGPIISVNSWGWTDGSPGMAGPKLSGTTASCVFASAQDASKLPTNRGYIATCPAP